VTVANPRRGLAALLALAAALAPVSSPALPAPTIPPPARAQASDEEIARFFDDYAGRTMKRLEIPGGAIMVVRDGRILLARGYGYADLAARRPVDVERSLFRAASISKLLPWLLVMQLVEEGRLDLDKDVNSYLDFRIPEAFGRPITMRHLMTHSAGFPERFHGVFDPDLSEPLGRKLRENIPERVYAPGTTIAYSNYGAALAGYIVERLRGEPWERVVGERIFAPLGMRHSTVKQPVPPALRPDLVSTYTYGSDEPGKFRVTPLAPMGALTASPADMGRLLAMLTHGGQAEGGRIVAPETLRRMFALEKPLGPDLPDGFGLGFLVGEYRGVHYAGHAGNMSTVATDLEILPDRGLAYYYVFNSQGANEEARKIRDHLLRAAIDRFGGAASAPPAAAGPSNAPDVAGAYISSRRIFTGPLMFSGLMNTTEARAEKDGSLIIESAGVLTHWLPAGRDRFVEEKTGIPLAITRDPDGRVARIASESLYPAAIFERAPPIVAWIPGVAAFSFGIFFLALIAKPIAWALSRRRRRSKGGAKSLTATNRTPRLTRWARRSYWAIAAALAGWGAFGLCLAIDFEFLFTVPSVVPLGLALLSLLSLPFALLILADAAASWRDPERNWPTRIGASLLAPACCGIAWLFYMLDVADPTLAW
jgi:CubicO group peptidase (beta-lactamase class C family)